MKSQGRKQRGKESNGRIGKKREPHSEIYSIVPVPFPSSALHSKSLEGLLPRCRLKFREMRVRFKCQVPDARIRRHIFIRHGIDKYACALCVRAHRAIVCTYTYLRRRIFFKHSNRWKFRDWTCFNSDDGVRFGCYIQMLYFSISKEFIRYFWINISSLVISQLTERYIHIYILYNFSKARSTTCISYIFSISRAWYLNDISKWRCRIESRLCFN